MERRRLVTVPASSANLGPGFDSFAVALSLSMELEVTETGSFGVDTDLAIARDRRNLVVRGFERLHPPDDFSFTIRSEIPLSGGLGTSAAAYLAGLMAADHLFELDADLLALAAELDGHPDNAAAALHGGFVVTTGGEVTRFDSPDGLEAVLIVPNEAVSTREARAALPDQVPIADAVFNVAHGALLMLGLARGDFELIARGLDDRLHQSYRGPLYPRTQEMIARAKEFGALGATLSGAGPTVLAWTTFDTTGGVVEALSAEASEWAQIKRVRFEAGGADVKEL
jgi:homoserine kinase